jgi:sialate O-acetylesterase
VLLLDPALAPLAAQELELPAILSDGMVLPAGRGAPIWGRARATPDSSSAAEKSAVDAAQAAAGVSGTVHLTLRGSVAEPVEAEGAVQADGGFEILLPVPQEAGPYELTLVWKGNEQQELARRELHSVWAGEVWLASGQSNMEWALGWVGDATEGGALPDPEPRLHLFQVPNHIALESDWKGAGSWQRAEGPAAFEFSAVAFFFGRRLERELDCPIGLVDASWGGTRIEAWLSPEALGAQEGLQFELRELERLRASRDAGEAENAARVAAWVAELDRLDPGYQGAWWRAEMSAEELKKAGFAARQEPRVWSQDGLKGYEGSRWVRRAFDVPSGAPLAEAILELGPIDDMDRCFVNGVRVGGMEDAGAWNIARRYALPEGLLTIGQNLLVLRIMDTGGEGGFTGKSEEFGLLLANGSRIPLAGEFLEAPGVDAEALPEFPVRVGFNEHTPCSLYQGMLAPLGPFAFSGGIWYQGESNREHYGRYGSLQSALVADWRQHSRDPALPFFAVEIAPFAYDGDRGEIARLREAQRRALNGPGLGLAATLDIGNPADIHPVDKRTVGERLARLALARAYGRDAWRSGEALVAEGPVAERFSFEGPTAKVHFRAPLEPLSSLDGQTLRGFEVAGADRRFYAANASLDGFEVLLSAPQVAAVVACRYVFNSAGDGNLGGASGLPVPPFRSDDWPILPAELEPELENAGVWQNLGRSDWLVVNGAALGSQATWSFSDDGLRTTGRPTGLLLSRQSYRDFVLEFEWRHLQPGGNSGLFIWSAPLPGIGSPFARAIEVQIMDGEPGDWYTTQGDVFPTLDGELTPHNGRGGDRAFPTQMRQQPAPQWNHYRVIARDGRVELWSNGLLVTSAEKANPREGHLALEAEGSPVEFRHMRLKPLLDGAALGLPQHPYRRMIGLYSGVDLVGWREVPAPNPGGSAPAAGFVVQDWRLVAEGIGRLELSEPIVEWPARRERSVVEGAAPGRRGRGQRPALRVRGTEGEQSGLSARRRRVQAEAGENPQGGDAGGTGAAAAQAEPSPLNRPPEAAALPQEVNPQQETGENGAPSSARPGAIAPAQAPVVEALDLSLDFTIVSGPGRRALSATAGAGSEASSSPTHLLPIEIPGVVFDAQALNDRQYLGNVWYRLVLRLRRETLPEGSAAAPPNLSELGRSVRAQLSAELNGQPLPLTFDAALFLTPDGRLTWPGLALCPDGCKVEFANVLLGEPAQ